MNQSEKEYLELYALYNNPVINEEKPEDFIKTYSHINYCEIIILENGNILQVNPSHTILLTRLAKKATGVDDEQIFPFNEYGEYLLYETGAVSVWYDFQMHSGNYPLTKSQDKTLALLAKNEKISGINLKFDTYSNHCGFVPKLDFFERSTSIYKK